jgi:hypothetical protein
MLHDDTPKGVRERSGNLKYDGEKIKNKEGSETAELLSTDAG